MKFFQFLPAFAFALGFPSIEARHGHHKESALVKFFKRVYEIDAYPGALTFREGVATSAVIYANGVHYGL